jgi:hypothetical protein
MGLLHHGLQILAVQMRLLQSCRQIYLVEGRVRGLIGKFYLLIQRQANGALQR